LTRIFDLSTPHPRVAKQGRFAELPATSTVRNMSSPPRDVPAGRISMRSPCAGCGCLDGSITTKKDRTPCGAPSVTDFATTRRGARLAGKRARCEPVQRLGRVSAPGFSCATTAPACCATRVTFRSVGHLISVYDGQKLGLSDAELASDGNLAAMCAACNSGLSTESLPPRLLAAALWARANGGVTRRPA
jgi:hypothetical protein